MKPILLIALLLSGAAMVGCNPEYKPGQQPEAKNIGGYWEVVTIDSCEYIVGDYMVYGAKTICHKGNCKFCAERLKQKQ